MASVNQAESKRQLYSLSRLPRKFKTAASLSSSLGESAERASVASQGLCDQDKVISLRITSTRILRWASTCEHRSLRRHLNKQLKEKGH